MAEFTEDTATSSEKRREYPRFEADTKVRLVRTDGSARGYEATCMSVAIGGVGVHVMAEFEVGEQVEVQFADSLSPSFVARIVYRRGDRYCLAFDEVV
jgi:hypothetical protein